MGKWFLSYSSLDENYAVNILEIFENHGQPCFFAKRDINVGESYAGRIKREIEECDQIVLLLSQDANDSQQVLREINQAVNNRKKILPLIIKPVKLSDDMEYYLGVCQSIDLTHHGIGEYESILVNKLFGGNVKKADTQKKAPQNVESAEKKPVEKPIAEPKKDFATITPQKTASTVEKPGYIKNGQYVIYIVGFIALLRLTSIIEHASIGGIFGWIGCSVLAALVAVCTIFTDKPKLQLLGLILGTFCAWVFATLIFGLLHFILPLGATFSYVVASIIYLIVIFIVWAMAS